MPEILLTRKPGPALTDEQRLVVREVLFGVIDGLGEVNSKAWRRFVGGLLKMEPGEVARIFTQMDRSGPYHRRHMKIEATIFDNQERFQNFKQFRDWLKIGAGLVDWFPGPRGGVVPIPKSIAYESMEQGEFELFHEAAIAFLRTPHAVKTLWPHASSAARDAAVEGLLSGFGE